MSVSEASHAFEGGTRYVPPTFAEMPVMTSELQTAELLRAQAASLLPGFVIRMSDAPVSPKMAKEQHRRCVELVVAAFHACFTDRAILENEVTATIDGKRVPFTGLGQDPIGPLHHDNDPVKRAADDPDDIHYTAIINTCTRGGGRVLMAGFGTDHESILALFGASATGKVNHPHLALKHNKVDPRIMNPAMLQTTVHAGDTVVMAFDAWHRYDTDQTLGKRSVINTDLEDWPRSMLP